MNKQPTISRRQMLISLGVIGTGVAACACGTSASLGLWLWHRSHDDNIVIVTNSSTPIPMPPIVSRSAWNASLPNHSASNENGFYSNSNPEGWRVYDDDVRDAYQTIIIHHAAFYEGDDLATLAEVQRVHRQQRGWADVAYHFMIGQNGMIYEGRDYHVRGTHVGGHNTGSLGICLLGNFMTQTPTALQLDSTLKLIEWAVARLSPTHIASHRDFNAQTQCPGDNLYPYVNQFAEAVGLQVGTGGYIAPDQAAHCACCNCHSLA